MNTNLQTRRNFIKTTTVAAAAAPLVGSWARAAEPDKKLGFALVGLGNLSTNQIAPALQKTKNCRLAGIVTGTPAKAEKWKKQYNIPDANIYNYDTMGKMADNPDIDVVYVVTPNALHGDHTIKAANAGKHVLCEKPMEVSAARCEEMIAACRKAGRQLAIGYRCQFEPHHLECRRLAQEKTFGDLKLIEAGFGFAIGDPTQWRLKQALAGGGPLMDVGIYALQTACFLTGEDPILITAIATTTDPVKFKEVEESIAWQLRFPGGAIADCNCTYKFMARNSFTARAEKGWFGLDPAYYYNGTRGERSDRKQIEFPTIDQFAAEMDDFAQCIMSGKPTKVPGEQGLRDVKIMMAAYESARTGKAVSLA
jgi:predicted dehydrogenase